MNTKLLLTLGLLTSALCLPAFAQNTVVTYQGRVTSNGTNFTGSGQFKAALVTVTNNNHTATATANPPSGGFITVINVTSGGNGYVTPPAVTITGGGGSGATATASLSGGVVTGITVNNVGSGYSSTPMVMLSAPPESLTFTTYWSNDGTSSAGSEPAAAVSATVVNGLFTLRLGDPTWANMTALNAGLFQQPDLHLRLWFNNGVNGFAALSPSQPLTTTPYAAVANAANTLTTAGSQPVTLSVNGTNVLRIALVNGLDGITANSVGGSPANVISNGFVGSFIGGGGNRTDPNRVGADYASVLGGAGNLASGTYSTAMGAASSARGYGSTAMGLSSSASGYAATAMGLRTRASGSVATAIGIDSVASGDYSVAMGASARAIHAGSFVWADSTFTGLTSTTTNQFRVRAAGGMEVVGGTATEAFKLSGSRSGDFNSPVGLAVNQNTAGNSAPAFRVVNQAGNSAEGALSVSTAGTGFIARFGNASAFVADLSTNGTWRALAYTPLSDRNAKENFSPVNPRDVLDKVAALPLTRWNYKAAPGLDHLGPVAQDFHAAFGLNGADDKHIATVDADGVALAAIQGLNEKMEQQLKSKDALIAELEERLSRLEKLISDAANERLLESPNNN